MRFIWPRPKTAIAKAVTAAVSLAWLGGVLAWCPVMSHASSSVISSRTPLTQLEKTLRRVPAHISEFSPLSEPLALPKCAIVRPPEALLTPDPLLNAEEDNLRVRVSFIVGADGRVHSAFVLDSGGPGQDQIVLRTVHFWRYRPALCNGVPSDSEAVIRFSAR